MSDNRTSDAVASDEGDKAGDMPLDVATVSADDRLLDSLGRGQAAPADDELAVMLAAWRRELAGDGARGTVPVLRRAVSTAVSAAAATQAAWARTHDEIHDQPRDQTRGPARQEAPRQRIARSRRRALVGIAAAVVAVVGAVTGMAVGGAGPDSRLWPITKMVYGDRAESRLVEQAEQAIVRAREALAAHQYAQAQRLLGEATALVHQIGDEAVVRRLLDEIAILGQLLPASAPARPTPAGGLGDGKGGTGTAGQTPGPGSTDDGLLPPLPLVPLPSISLPVLPTLPPLLP